MIDSTRAASSFVSLSEHATKSNTRAVLKFDRSEPKFIANGKILFQQHLKSLSYNEKKSRKIHI